MNFNSFVFRLEQSFFCHAVTCLTLGNYISVSRSFVTTAELNVWKATGHQEGAPMETELISAKSFIKDDKAKSSSTRICF